MFQTNTKVKLSTTAVTKSKPLNVRKHKKKQTNTKVKLSTTAVTKSKTLNVRKHKKNRNVISLDTGNNSSISSRNSHGVQH